MNNNYNLNIKCIRFSDCVLSIYDYLKNKYDFEIIEEYDSLINLKLKRKNFIDEFGNNITDYSIIKVPHSFIFDSAIITDLEKFKSKLNNFELEYLNNSYPYLEIYTWLGPPVYLPFSKEDKNLLNNYIKSIDLIMA